MSANQRATLSTGEALTASQDVVLPWAYELRRMCREYDLDALAATKGDSTLHVTKDRARITDPRHGLVEVPLEDEEPAGLFDPEEGERGADADR